MRQGALVSFQHNRKVPLLHPVGPIRSTLQDAFMRRAPMEDNVSHALGEPLSDIPAMQ